MCMTLFLLFTECVTGPCYGMYWPNSLWRQFNWFLDFQRKHPAQLSKPKQTYSVSSTSRVAGSKLTSFINAKKKYDARDPQQIRATNRIVSFFAGTHQPLSIVEAEEFMDMIHTIDQKIIIPSRKHLSTTLIIELVEGDPRKTGYEAERDWWNFP